MLRVEIQDNSDKTGFWVYIVNVESGKKFMLSYVNFSHGLRAAQWCNIKYEKAVWAEGLIKFMEQ